MGFVLGLIISTLFIMCVILETSKSVRLLFSIILLLGVFTLVFAVFKAGLLFNPLFLAGIIVNFIFFFIALPFIMRGDEKDGK